MNGQGRSKLQTPQFINIFKKNIIMKTIKQLSNNQYYFYTESKIVFQSYETIVCTIENYEKGNEPIVRIANGQPQSKTTAKYLNQFLEIMLGVKNYKEIKSLPL